MAKGSSGAVILGLLAVGGIALAMSGEKKASAAPVPAGPPGGGPLPVGGPTDGSAPPTYFNPSVMQSLYGVPATPAFYNPAVLQSMYNAGTGGQAPNVGTGPYPKHDAAVPTMPGVRPEDLYPLCSFDAGLPQQIHDQLAPLINSYPGPSPDQLLTIAATMEAAGYPQTGACFRRKAAGENIQTA